MSSNRDNGYAGNFARLTAAILFVSMLRTGYTVSPQLESAVASPVTADERDTQEPELLASDCAVDGLVFPDCNFDL